jgi:hypothetical protein
MVGQPDVALIDLRERREARTYRKSFAAVRPVHTRWPPAATLILKPANNFETG